jgi:hypothetical protein
MKRPVSLLLSLMISLLSVLPAASAAPSGKLYLFLDGSREVDLEQPPMADKGASLLPLRFIAENLGILVRWDKPTRSINLWTSDLPRSSRSAACTIRCWPKRTVR